MGDLNPTNPFYIKNLGAGVSVKYNFNPTWGVKLGANYLIVDGNDNDFKNNFQKNRRLLFRNQLKELALTTEFNFFKIDGSKGAKKYTPFLSAGVAGLIHDPYIYYYQNKINLRELKLEYDENNTNKYSKFALAIPIGVGFKYKLDKNWRIGVDLSYRTVFSDYIDNVSNNYPSAMPKDIQKPNITIIDNGISRSFDENDWKYLADPSKDLENKSGTARGDSKKFDGILTAGITLNYTLISSKCYFW